MSISSTQKCPDCSRWLYPGDAGCDCYVAELEARDEAIRDGRCLPCLGLAPDPRGKLCVHHGAQHAAGLRALSIPKIVLASDEPARLASSADTKRWYERIGVSPNPPELDTDLPF